MGGGVRVFFVTGSVGKFKFAAITGRCASTGAPPAPRRAWTASGCCTPTTTRSPRNLTAAYKQLIALERGRRDMKGALRPRPVFHHREDRIRAHVQLCWLALLLIRVAENAAGDTWRTLHHELDRMHLVTLATADGRVAQRSATTAAQQAILGALKLRKPPKFVDFTPACWAAIPGGWSSTPS